MFFSVIIELAYSYLDSDTGINDKFNYDYELTQMYIDTSMILYK